ncbi:MAG: tryptophan synthase subunit alpha [Clostridiales Family XIII bacterium]|jgi:tryptophan synthase alpha chain|nr:tryptophan synthase subunit alpha [Clostridiales Family XIII bacterium]
MDKISGAFARGHKALICFLTGGDPDIETTERLVLAMAEEGVDLIEIGVPFSDPIAEGPVIREASERALLSGTTLDSLFALVRRLRGVTDVPIVFMTYFNPVYKYGVGRFAETCAANGVDGVIIPDLPWEERSEFLAERSAGESENVKLISLIAPTSLARAEDIARSSEGFLYCVSSLGVTGVRENIGAEIGGVIGAVRKVSDIPCAIGFGISTPEQAEKMAALADGVIVGSAIVRIIAAHGGDSETPVREFVRSLRAAVR